MKESDYKIKMHLDFETRSEVDIKKRGASVYAMHESTEVICFAYAFNSGEVKTWQMGEAFPSDFIKALTNKRVLIKAHNAFFEQVILKYVLKYDISPSRFSCTAARAAYNGLPRKLEKAAQAAKLRTQKDMSGNRVMLKHSKPTIKWSNWNKKDRIGPEPKKWHDDMLERIEILEYCIQDVIVERELDNITEPLPDLERKYWILNQEMNHRGVRIDLESVSKINMFTDIILESNRLKVVKLTNGEINSANQVGKIKEYIQDRGYLKESLSASDVKESLKDPELSNEVKEILRLRQLSSKSSVKKYRAMIDRTFLDDRVRDLTMYYGASTGRESGTGLQVQNLPKGKVKNPSETIEYIKSTPVGFLNLIYKSPLDVFSGCIRGMITASEGKSLFVSDFNAIECRVLNWLANDQRVLKIFSDFDKTGDMNTCPYRLMAARILGKRVEEITDDERFLGKTATLGCGYQLGAARFYEMCTEWGVPNVTKDLAKKAVQVYRDFHQPVTKLWENYEKAAIAAVITRQKVAYGKVVFEYKNKVLWINLPSGRALAYRDPFIKHEPTPWGEMRPKLYYFYWDKNAWVNGPTYGGLITENISQAIARDITMSGVMNATNLGFDYLFQVHDEVICEADKTKFNIGDYNKALTDLPDWAKGLPMKASGWVGERYRK